MRGLISWAALALAACSPPSVAMPTGSVEWVMPGEARLEPADVIAVRNPPVVPLLGEPEDLRGPTPAIGGGTLLRTRSGRLVAGDELRSRLYVIDPGRAIVSGVVELEVGMTPGRMAEDASGVVHVVTRGVGALLRVDPDGPALLSRTAPCSAPRGVAFDPTRELIHVACAGGELVSLTPEHEVVRTLRLDPDLRDVVALDDRLYVTRFRAAELIVLDADGVELARSRPPEERFLGVDPPVVMVPRVAWRMRPAEDGVLVTHQHHVATDLGPLAVTSASGATTYYGPPSRPDLPAAILEHRITRFDRDGNVSSSVRTANLGLLVDIAAWGPGFIGAWAGPSAGTARVAVEPIDDGRFAILHQSDAILVGIHDPSHDVDLFVPRPRPLMQLDPGHRVFHASSGVGIACASCHPEGHEDGHAWITPESGVRRSQSLLGGLRGTEPFHWGGELEDFDGLMDAQAERMFREFSTTDRESTLDWLDGLRNPPAAGTPTAEGEAAFAEAGCATCHVGERRSDELNHDVGAGPIQTPRLAGVVYRAPWLHDGCASTLEETLDGTCRPLDAHGVADSVLRVAVVDYLRAL